MRSDQVKLRWTVPVPVVFPLVSSRFIFMDFPMDFIHRFHPRCELYGKYKSRGFEAAIEVAQLPTAFLAPPTSTKTRCWPSLATSLVDKSRAATLKWRPWNEKKLSRNTEDNISYQKETKNAKNWGRRKTLKETAKENSALFWEVFRAGLLDVRLLHKTSAQTPSLSSPRSMSTAKMRS